jgi:hypothetical protein
MKCPICNQKSDLFVSSHKDKPFVDNKLYPKICFTCFCVPKTIQQKYNKEGLLSEEIHLEYCIKNLHNAKELFEQGSADTMAQAKRCVNAVKNLTVASTKKPITLTKPKTEVKLY